ncbi:rhodanese-like domain-containing protein [Macrococcoides goetzii]|uniref:Rhodanese-like domain-containing protein n=1 Tax=Macrococcoides goetzii TaxID=1891097 RepID=A0A395GC66_9STAP|nr:rhodanese-like domain-containing protein [Macrococcus goetzii]RAI81143.1 rhodanese-like domain-containing protein [Macrococcus goetzii]
MTNYQTINVETLQSLLNQKEINLIDVREVYEYEDNHIPEAVNIPLSVLVENTDQFKKEEHYHIICRSGNRSGQACQYLSGLGIATTNVDGGMLDWEAL